MLSSRKSLVLGGAAFVLVLLAGGSVKAQSPYTGAYGHSYFYAPYNNTYFSERLPYFALHPPVYYSVPIPRTYGYSPFAYPPYVMTPEFEPTGKLDVENPHVPRKPAAKPTSDKTVAVPSMMINPYVESNTQIELSAN